MWREEVLGEAVFGGIVVVWGVVPEFGVEGVVFRVPVVFRVVTALGVVLGVVLEALDGVLGVVLVTFFLDAAVVFGAMVLEGFEKKSSRLEM